MAQVRALLGATLDHSSGVVWQKRYYDRNVRDEREFVDKPGAPSYARFLRVGWGFSLDVNYPTQAKTGLGWATRPFVRMTEVR